MPSLTATYDGFRGNRFHFGASLESLSPTGATMPHTPWILVIVPLHNNARTLARTLASIENQQDGESRLVTLIVNDGSSDNWRNVVRCGGWTREIWSVSVSAGSAARCRNFGLLLARSFNPPPRFIMRLDADDELADVHTVARVERGFRQTRFSLAGGISRPADVLLCSNLQKKLGTVLPRPNLADPSLLNASALMTRLEGMAAGDATAELPSCNLVLTPQFKGWYPLVASAEDHWLTVSVLTDPSLRVGTEPDILHTIYSLDGGLTSSNKEKPDYESSRHSLLQWAAKRVARGGRG